ncbi:MAG: FtsW/RodA/SpoVE family cell cycle protein [Chitinophagales bacterium]|nr:FtsW/RodA/SpoVE family cell cycle protein [Chitinophagaceae bacterium]MCB9063715.1 FtsW/RodA/SpoVE family cell cycle protein [Chitinophagales bacterium]
MNRLLKHTKGDQVIWAVVFILSFISLLAVYSATGSLAYKHDTNANYYLVKQVIVLGLGLVIIYLIHRVNYTKFARIAVLFYLLSIPLLLYTLVFGVKLNEGSRWIQLPVIGMTIQTSALAKLALFMFLARMLSLKQAVIKDFKKGFLPVLTPVLITAALIAPANLSTAVMIGVTCCILFFIGRVRVSHILLLAFAGLIGGLLLYGVSKVTGWGRADTWEKRIVDFAGSSDDGKPKEDVYQVLHAKIAIANGGVMGLGPGNSQQRNFLPHSYSDFIYAMIIEEYGLVGAAFVVMLYLVFLWRSILIFRRCPYAFGAFLAVGLSMTLVFQAMLNMAVNVNLVPVTGLTLPLVSMGGSSVWFTSIAIGVILSVSRYVDETEGKKKLQEANETDGKEHVKGRLALG